MRHGFSLVELSIVLVILGLLTGGILAGKSLIRASELRSVSADLQKLHSSVYAYRDKYLALPGDHSAAFDFFGTNCAATAAACNGNGDGWIGNSIAGAGGSLGESYRAIQELALAGLIEGSFTGVKTTPPVRGVNVLPSKMDAGTYFIFGFNEDNFFTNRSGGALGAPNHVYVGSVAGAAGWPNGSLLTPEESWNVDTKLDDGKPGTGKMLGSTPTSGCIDSATRATAEYVLSSTSVSCSLAYRL